MPFVSVTRLRLRSIRYLPGFAIDALRTRSQVAASTGFVSGSLLPDRRLTFWTLTMWDKAESMRAYITSGSHRVAMPKLMHWCDEASIVHWDQPDAAMPDWAEADMRMRRDGRPSKVRHPTPEHLAMAFAPTRLIGAQPIRPTAR